MHVELSFNQGPTLPAEFRLLFVVPNFLNPNLAPPTHIQEWSRQGVEQHIYPTLDFTPPSMESIQEGITVLEKQRAKKNTVYVHCKAGKGRSAVMATCYVIKVCTSK